MHFDTDGLEAGLNEIRVLAFQYKAAQLPSRISPGIYVDAVGADLWRRDRGMAMDNDLAEVLFVKQKILADG